jgi:cytochrome c peroxidase
LDTGDRSDETDRDDEDHRHDDAEDDDCGAGVRRVDADADHAQHGGDCEDEEVPPLRNLVVRFHELEMHVLGEVVVGFGLADPLLDAAVQALEAECNVVAVVQERVGDG